MTYKNVGFCTFGPAISDIPEQDVPCPDWHGHCKHLTGLLLDDADALLFPVYVAETKSDYVGGAETHRQSDA
jgi:hypothetical protein